MEDVATGMCFFVKIHFTFPVQKGKIFSWEGSDENTDGQ